MASHWSEKERLRVIPPQTHDARGLAVLEVLDQIIGTRPIADFYVKDPDICSSELLPALTAEWSMQEYIDPSWPDHVIRRILKERWALQSSDGFDSGVRLGLSLLGMRMLIKHWHQELPVGQPDTHTITFLVGEVLFDENAVLGPRIIAAANRMINATKRWSQDSAVRIGVDMRNTIGLATAASPLQVERPDVSVQPITSFLSNFAISNAASATELVRPKVSVNPVTAFRAGVQMASGASVTQVHRITAIAA